MEENPATTEINLAKQYQFADVEKKWAERWVQNPFTVNTKSNKQPYCIVLPPPNVTGFLHLGHSNNVSIIDTLIRYKRMRGFETLFQPGTDHAGIATQIQVERALAKEGKTKHDLGREAFLERIWVWKEEYGDIILQQLQRLGISADWSRTRFTMDAGLSKAVRKQFVELYHRGLIYRGRRIVDWDPKSQTTLSDLEVDREEHEQTLYTLAYDFEGGGEIQIATQRPETIFADQAIAVHPKDERFKNLVGKKARIPLTNRFIPVITDEMVEIDFGTGALKVTPAHDPTDFEIGQRHGLETPSVIDLEAKLFSELVPEPFRGKDRFEVRPEIVAALHEAGAIRGEKAHTVALGFSQRTETPVEPILSTQWFFKMSEIAPQVIEGLNQDEMRLHPERYTKVNRAWLENLRDWNISRQLWWGHQIPAWYDIDGKVYVPDPENPYLDPPDDPRYAGVELTQDPDVFDTWFSSSLWPFSTLGWPDADDLFYKKFYPTSVLVTGYDILFFWVTKMQLAGYALTEQKPFSDIMLHGLLLDEYDQKMSKSKGNGIDPLEVIEQFGADALRFAMTYTSTGGQDIRWDARRLEMGRNFNNKLWNAARFAFMNLEGEVDHGLPETLADCWIVSRLQRAVKTVAGHLDNFDIGLANRVAYNFVWSEFCDWYLEAAKPALHEGSPRTRFVLKTTLTHIIKLLHPLIPFITSELYEALGHKEQVGWSDWPGTDESLINEAAEQDFGRLQEAIGAVRNLRGEVNVNPGRKINIHASGTKAGVLQENRGVFELLAKVTLLSERPRGQTLSQMVTDIKLEMPFEGLVDVNEWQARQKKKLAGLGQDKAKAEKRLANPKFIENAPEEVVTEERRRFEEAERLMKGIEASLAQLG